MDKVSFQESGGYRFVHSTPHRSAGVAALSGFAIRRVRLRRPLPLGEGFATVHRFLRSIDRPITAFCACELRCPAPLSDRGLQEFNSRYLGQLERWGLMRDGSSPVARSEVCPQVTPPGRPTFHAFCVTVPQPNSGAGSFVTSSSSGSAATLVPEQTNEPWETTRVAPAILRKKAEQVLTELEARMRALGFSWRHATATQLYTVHDFHPFMAEIIERRGAAPAGLTWHLARPPLLGTDYQMDVRGVAMETVI
jgi:hypothetical protein